VLGMIGKEDKLIGKQNITTMRTFARTSRTSAKRRNVARFRFSR
jgi:hypothetical protein